MLMVNTFTGAKNMANVCTYTLEEEDGSERDYHVTEMQHKSLKKLEPQDGEERSQRLLDCIRLTSYANTEVGGDPPSPSGDRFPVTQLSTKPLEVEEKKKEKEIPKDPSELSVL